MAEKQYRKIRYVDAEHKMIGADVLHPVHGWIPTGLRGDCPETGDDFRRLAAGEVGAYEPPSMESRRLSASLTRQEFCLALKRVGVLTGPDAIQAAKGDWPSAFNAALPTLAGSGIDADEAQITWASANIIERNHPLVGLMAHVAGLTDTQLDALFGIEE